MPVVLILCMLGLCSWIPVFYLSLHWDPETRRAVSKSPQGSFCVDLIRVCFPHWCICCQDPLFLKHINEFNAKNTPSSLLSLLPSLFPIPSLLTEFPFWSEVFKEELPGSTPKWYQTYLSFKQIKRLWERAEVYERELQESGLEIEIISSCCSVAE